MLAAFGASDALVVPLLGGAGTAWRAADIVLKPADSVRSARWTAGVFSALSGPGFRVPRPVLSAAGEWVVDGWAAWRFVGRDGSPWTVADQVAWGERDAADLLRSAGRPLGQQVHRLLSALRPVELPAQLVHGDLGGNMIFADGAPPAVIDFAPYWRPAGLAMAVGAADALLWRDGDPAILGALAAAPELDQLLARALVYRLVTEIIVRGDERGLASGALDAVSRKSQPVTDLVLARLAGLPRPAAYLDDRRLAALTGRAVDSAVVELRPVGTATGSGGQAAAMPGGAVGHTRAVRRLAQPADGRDLRRQRLAIALARAARPLGLSPPEHA